MNQYSLRDAALRYAAMGWPVFPLHPKAKTPIYAGGFHVGANAAVLADQWWTFVPNANIGLWTRDHWALDVDGPTGRESLAALEAQHGPLPETLRSRTGRTEGGTHWLWRKPEGVEIPNTVGAIAPKLDTRGGSGYIVLPPSVHESGGRYQWIDDADPASAAIAPTPAWLVDLVVATAHSKAAKSIRAEGREPIGEGGRYNYLFSFGCKMRRIGMEEEEIYAALCVRNQTWCSPPLEDEEVTYVAAGAAKFKTESEKAGRLQWSPKIQKMLEAINQ